MELNDTLKFLIELSSNNSKEWFDSNRKTYQERRSDFLGLVDNIINDIAQFDCVAAKREDSNGV